MRKSLAGLGMLTIAGVCLLGCDKPPPPELTQVNELSNPTRSPPPEAQQQTRLANISVPEAASPPEDGQWTMPSRDYANTRYSGLDEITTDNVGKLQLAFTFATGTLLGQESAPIFVGDTLYFVTPFPNILYAVDLAQPGRSEERRVGKECR